MSSVTNFDTAKFYLGTLCRRGHDYNGTGKSLRHLVKGGTGNCLECRGRDHNSSHITDNEKLIAIGIDPKKFYLGRACPLQHTYQKTNKCLRRRSTRICVECHKILTYKWREQNPSRHLQNARNQYYCHRDERIAKHKLWRTNNSDWQQKYRQTEKGRSVGKRYQQKRRIILSLNHASGYSSDELMVRFQEFDNCCAYCGQKATSVDHVIPINSGGPDVISNLLPSCRPCNSSKGTNPLETWYKSQLFFCPKRWKRILKVLGKTEHNLSQLPLF